jgi:RES domain-containing protein
MLLWRISQHRDLSGKGGLAVSARWHHAGRPVVYLAECPPGSLLEVCVHTSLEDLPPRFTLLEVSAPESLGVENVDAARLPSDWVGKIDVTRQLGTDWLEAGKTPFLRVPSALVPRTTNMLLNPKHPDAKKAKIVNAWSYPFDNRLKL